MTANKLRLTHTFDSRIPPLLKQLCKNSGFKGKFHGMSESKVLEKLILAAAKEELDLDFTDFSDYEGAWMLNLQG